MSGPPEFVAPKDTQPRGSYLPDIADPGTLAERLRQALAPNLLLVREIGAGGMARVFLAREPALKRLVAVKVLSGELASTDAGRARFEREAQAVAGLSHPNVVAVHSVGELADGAPYFIMQYVEGRSMADRIEREGALSIAEAHRALGEVAAALAAAHKQGIIHRDIKPANVLYEDATGRCLVSDFGIAAIGREPAQVNTKLTATGVIIGTPQYMSPEQLLAEPVTDKTDVYSLGLLAHELLCGTAPFKGTSPHELIAAHLRDVPARLSVRRSDVDPELDAVVARCLEKDAANRPTADEVARRLIPGGEALLEWVPPGLEELQGRLRGVSTSYMAGAGLVSLAMLVIVAGGPSIDSALVSPATLLLLIGVVAGVLGLAVAIWRTIRVARLVTRAVGIGYGWLTVLETLSDVRGDTGNLIAASREYAGLAVAERDGFRGNRIQRELALLLGGVIPVPLFVLTVILGSRGYTAWGAVWLSVLAPFGGLAGALFLGLRERQAFAARRRRRRAGADVSQLAKPWYESFEAARKGQVIGRGPSGRARTGWWAAIAAVSLLVYTVLLLLPLAFVGTVGPTYWTIVAPKFGNTKDKLRIATLVRSYILPKDTAISPLEAGRAFYALHGPANKPSDVFPEHPVPIQLPRVPWSDPMAANVFPTARFSQVENLTSPLTIMAAVRRGVSPPELAYLERIARMPQWKYYDMLARARSLDYAGARFIMPFPANANVWALPIPPFALVKSLAYASVSRAAYFLATSKRDSAEAALRSTISLGFLLVDHGNTLIEALIGVVTVGIGRGGLIDYWKAIGDPRGPALQARVDSTIAQIEAESAARESAKTFENVDIRDVAAMRAATIRTAVDVLELRGLRFEMLNMLGMAPCTNLRELVFGPDVDMQVAFARARPALTRFPSDSLLIDIMERQPEVLGRMDGGGDHALQKVARVVGNLLGNDRLRGCSALLSEF